MDLNGSAESQGDLVRTLETMVRIRAFENKLGAMFKKGQLPGFVHLSVGQEATAVGTCSELRPDDTVSTTHRGHGHMIAKGADLRRMMAEILGRTDGYCKGMGGSMHLMDLELGIIGANGIVGAGIGLATGAAIADQTLGRDKVNVVFFGDGASNSGIFFESMNLAAIWKLPVIFICENNGYTEWMRTEDITADPVLKQAQVLRRPRPGQVVWPRWSCPCPARSTTAPSRWRSRTARSTATTCFWFARRLHKRSSVRVRARAPA